MGQVRRATRAAGRRAPAHRVSGMVGPHSLGLAGPTLRRCLEAFTTFHVPQISGLKITRAQKYATTFNTTAAASKTWPIGSVNSRIVLS